MDKEEDNYDHTCEEHRRKHGLILNYNKDIECKTECEAEATCPLNPNNYHFFGEENR
jgi:hypothetical protein